MNRKLLCLGAVALLSCFYAIAAQEAVSQAKSKEETQEETFKAKTELVEVHAVVTDSHGHMVENLKKEDFQLLENNHQQKISFFSVSRVEEPESPASAKSVPLRQQLSEPPARTTVLFVDNLHLEFSNLNWVKQQLRRFVDERMTLRDSIALVTSSRVYGIAQQFTRDRQALRYAIDRISLGPNQIDRGIFPYLAARITLGDNLALEKGKQILKAEGIDDKSGAATRARSLMVLDEASLLRETTLASLKAVTEQMIGMSGQRMVVIFSEGFTQHGRNGWPEYDQVRSATNEAVRAGVVIYSIDAKSLARDGGNDPDGYAFAAAQEELGGMFSMAKDTGGETYVNTNNLSGALSEALDANRFYYVLAYYPAPGEDPHQFRDIRVRVLNHPEYKIRTPKGFTVPTNEPDKEKEEKEKEPQKNLIRAINAIKPVSDINVLSRMDFIGLKDRKQQVMLTVSFDGDKLQYRQRDQHQIINLEILYSIFDSAGRQVEAHSADVEGVLTSERAAEGRTNGYLFSKLLVLKPGIYQARVGVRETASGRAGTATAWIDVPNLSRKKLALSDLILFDSVPEKEADETGANPNKLRPVRMLQGIRLYPRDNVCSYVFRVFRNVKSGVDSDLTLKTELLKAGKPVKQSQWMPLTGVEKGRKVKGQAYIGGKIDFAGLKPAVYELIVSVKDSRSKKTAQRSVVFGIE